MGSEQLYAINQKMNVSKTCVTDNTSGNATCCNTCLDSTRARTMTHYENIKHLSNITHKRYYLRTHNKKNYSVQLCRSKDSKT